MTLEQIRKANENELEIAVRELIKHQAKMTLGEFHATTRAIYDRAKAIDANIERLNQIARGEL